MNQEKKIFLNNFLQLAFLKGVSHLLPLVVTPLLVKSIGLELFGSLEFAKAISFYFTAFVGYGFKFSATKEISLYPTDKVHIGKVISSIYTIKVVIIVICWFIMHLLIYCIPEIAAHQTFLLGFFPVVIGSSLFPTFVFQGINKMHWLTQLNLGSKLIFLSLIYMLIRMPSDAILFPYLLALVDFLRLGIALFLLYGKLGIKLVWPDLILIRQQLQEGMHFFLSQLVFMFYSRFPAIFIGFSNGTTMVAIYNLGEKLIKTTNVMLEPFMQALYPIVYKKIKENLTIGVACLKSYGKITLFILGLIGIGYVIFSQYFIYWLTGEKNLTDANFVLKLHAFLPAITFFNNLLGFGVLIPLRAGKKYTLVMLITSLICIGLHSWLVPIFNIKGAAWAILSSEIFASFLIFMFAFQTLDARKKMQPSY